MSLAAADLPDWVTLAVKRRINDVSLWLGAKSTPTDATGKVAPGMVVTLGHADGDSQHVVTDHLGRFRFLGVREGQVEVTASATGEPPSIADPLQITVEAGAIHEVDLALRQ